MFFFGLLLDPYSPDSFWYQFDGYWNAMNLVTRASIDLLALMLAIVVIVARTCLWRFYFARRDSRLFVQEAQPLFATENLGEAVRTARVYPESHIAGVTAAMLETFLSVSTECGLAEAVAFSERAATRLQSRFHAELSTNLKTLATIANTAPFLGLMGTTVGMFDAFGGTAESKATAFRHVVVTLGESLIPTAVGLLVAVLAVWFFNYFFERVEIFDVEMNNAASEIISYLSSHHPATRSPNYEPLFKYFKNLFDFQELLLYSMVGCGLYLAYESTEYVAITLVQVLIILIGYLVIYSVVWARHRRQSRIFLFP